MRFFQPTLIVLLPSLLAAADPALSLSVDLPALRTVMPENRPSSAWWVPTSGTPVRERIIGELTRLLANNPTLPQRLADAWSTTAGPAMVTVDHGTLAITTPAPAVEAPALSTAPIVCTWKADDFLTLSTIRRNQGVPIHLPLVSWRNATAIMTSELMAKNGSWTARTKVEGSLKFGWHALSPDIGKLAHPGESVTLAAGVEPKVVAEIILGSLTPAEGAFLQKMLGQRFDQAGALFTGDVLIQGSAKPLPQFGLVTALAAKADPSLLAQGVADAYRGRQTKIDGAVGAWILDTPIGPLTLAWNKERLVVGNAPELLKAWLAGTAKEGALPEGLALYGDADLPSLASAWLPVGLAYWTGADLEVDALALAAPQLAEIALANVQSPDKPKGLASVLKVGHQVSLTKGPITRTVLVGDDLVHRWLPELLGTVPVDEALSVYGGSDPQKVAVVVRTAAGWLILDDCIQGKRHAWDVAGLTKYLASIDCGSLRIGPAFQDQKVIAPPNRVRWDRTWIPSMAGQISAWRLEGKTLDNGITLEERGLPMAAMAAIYVALRAELAWIPEMQRVIQAPPPGPRIEL